MGICNSTDRESRSAVPEEPPIPLHERPGQQPAGGTAPLPGAMQTLRPAPQPPGSGTSDAFETLMQQSADPHGSSAEARPSSNRPQLPPLDMSAIDNNPRLHPPSPGIPSPETPSPTTMAFYTHPDRLPGPDGGSTHDGHDWVNHGKLESLTSTQTDLQDFRRHVAETPPPPGEQYSKPQKYLAFLEKKSETPVSLVLYRAEGSKPEASASRPIPDSVHGFDVRRTDGEILPRTIYNNERMVVTSPVNQGFRNIAGGDRSSATIAAHELLGHAALNSLRMGNETELTKPRGKWDNKEEQNADTKLANPVALAHGEGLTDSHEATLHYETGSITSTTPLHGTVARGLAAIQPAQQKITDKLNAMGTNSSNPDATPESAALYKRRAEMMTDVIEVAGNMPPAGGSSSTAPGSS